MRAFCVFSAAFLLLGSLLSGACTRGGDLEGKNVILLLVDTLRRDHLGCYGPHKGISPVLDRLASEGFSFSRAQAPSSWTKPSVASLFTGRYPGSHGAVGNLKSYWKFALLDDGLTTVAERFRAEGYRTAAFVTNPHIVPYFNFDQGFQEFTQPAGDARELLGMAARWIAANRGRGKFFLYLHLFDPHDPYFPPEAYRKRFATANPGDRAPYTWVGRPDEIRAWSRQYRDWKPQGSGDRFRFDYETFARSLDESLAAMSVEEIRSRVFLDFQGRDDPALLKRIDHLTGLYRGDVAYTDDALGDFLREMEGKGVLRDSVLVITSDHGESFLERDEWGHGFYVHAQEVEIPLIFRVPGEEVPLRGTCPDPVSLVDLVPTLLDMLGLPPAAGLDGGSLWPVIRDAPAPTNRKAPVLSELIMEDGDQVSAMVKGIKVIRTARPNRPVEWACYDLEKDPGEFHPMDPETAGDAARALQGAILEWIRNRALDLQGKGVELPVTEEMAEAMRRLGYM